AVCSVRAVPRRPVGEKVEESGAVGLPVVTLAWCAAPVGFPASSEDLEPALPEANRLAEIQASPIPRVIWTAEPPLASFRGFVMGSSVVVVSARVKNHGCRP